MAAYSVSCDGVALEPDGALYSLPVYTDGEGFNSYVYRNSDVSARTGPDVKTELLDVQVWLTSIWRTADGRLWVTDDDGNVRRYDGAAWTVLPVSRDALTTVWGLSDTDVYAGGDDGIVYRWTGGAFAAFSPPLGDTIFSIRGTSASDLYACGAGALLWHFDGRTWTRVTLPTNQRLTGLLTLSETDVLVCGTAGVLFRGAGAAWADVSQPGNDFHAIVRYGEQILLSAGGGGILSFDGAAVAPYKTTFISYRLAVNGMYLASAGDTLAARFDGTAWFGSRYN